MSILSRAFLCLAVVLASCANPNQKGPARTPAAVPGPTGVLLAESAPGSGSGNRDTEGPAPIYPEDARWGGANAPVTIVAVVDLQCPFCDRSEATLRRLREHYGPEKLRIVLKHYPLPFHPYAKPAAIAAMAVERAAGDDAVFRFVGTVYSRQAELDGAKLAEWAREASSSGSPHASALGFEEQLARDRAFADRAGVNGTPGFLINGVLLSGAQPYEAFSAIIDSELAAVNQARVEGKSASYADRAQANFIAPAKAAAADEPDEDLSIWKIPVGTSPVLGPADALVTVVEFSDYECPYCKRVQPVLEELRRRYGNDLRIVFKHNPLPFHARARPAAELALEAYREKGNAAFWTVTKALFDAPADGMAPDDLLRIAGAVGLNPGKVKAATERATPSPEIETDTELALDFNARGTPHFFVNGRRLAGAQPVEGFAALIDEQLGVATLLVEKGVARNKVYDLILDHAETPPPQTIVDLGVVPKDRAFRGAANAVVTVHEFSDFQCPFCGRVLPMLQDLRKEFPRDVKMVWHNLPLPFHSRARAAANAALEVRARGGDAAFWKMHDLVFENQKDLSDDKLADLGKLAGVSREQVLAAIHEGRYEASIAEDLALAERAGIHGTPGFVVNGYVISGAQPLTEFRRTVRRALADRAQPLAKPSAKIP
ncbi:MAG TPA: thioredoxin domain-containing protein [Polyangiaceae bacterium]